MAARPGGDGERLAGGPQAARPLTGPRRSAAAFSRLVDWWGAFARWVLLPALAVAVVVGFGTEISPARDAARGGGVRGTFVVTSHDCPRNVCHIGGVFTSHDGRVRRTDLTFPEGRDLDVGQSAEVSYVGGGVVFRPGGHEWVWFVVLTVIAALVVVAWLVLVGLRLRQHRRERA